jgi:hypothetical protein
VIDLIITPRISLDELDFDVLDELEYALDERSEFV